MAGKAVQGFPKFSELGGTSNFNAYFLAQAVGHSKDGNSATWLGPTYDLLVCLKALSPQPRNAYFLHSLGIRLTHSVYKW